MSSIPRESINPQTLWAEFKSDTQSLTKKHGSESHGKLAKRIEDIEGTLKTLASTLELDNDNIIRTNEAYLASELAILECIWEKDKKDKTRAVIANHSKVLGGIWSAMNKDRKPRGLIYQLKTTNTNQTGYERDSRRMAQLVRDYHDTLQSKDITLQDDSPNLDRRREEILQEIPASQRLSDQDIAETDWEITYKQVSLALKLLKNGMATGLDGLPYELWKELDTMYEKAEKEGEEGFDIIEVLVGLYKDIQTHRVDARTNFALGWMCPIYKKKDPTEISNYRPIILLNTDYKLLTKTLALQLVNPIHKLIHPNQAGFIPKRSIFDHIRLASTIINYAEVMEEDRAIVALDQEKAYDKI
jgi:hypothetical protein